MLERKRKFRRFDIPVNVSFRPTYGATEYTQGHIKNFSCEGLALEVNNFSFIRYENLEMNLKFSEGEELVSFFGNVVWKKQHNDTCTAGIKLKAMDGTAREELLNKIASFGNIPLSTLLFGKDTGNEVMQEMSAHQPAPEKRKPSLSKQYCKGGTKCIVTFRLPADAAPDARHVSVVGDFNRWNTSNTPMKKLKRGDFLADIELSCNKEYRFKYLIDGERWENDWDADKYIPNDFGAEDSVVVV